MRSTSTRLCRPIMCFAGSTQCSTLAGVIGSCPTRWVILFAACVKGRTSFTPLWALLIATSWQKPERCAFSNVRNGGMLPCASAPEPQQQYIEVWPIPGDVWFTRQLGRRCSNALPNKRVGHEQYGSKTNDRPNGCCDPGRDWKVSKAPTGARKVKRQHASGDAPCAHNVDAGHDARPNRAHSRA